MNAPLLSFYVRDKAGRLGLVVDKEILTVETKDQETIAIVHYGVAFEGFGPIEYHPYIDLNWQSIPGVTDQEDSILQDALHEDEPEEQEGEEQEGQE